MIRVKHLLKRAALAALAQTWLRPGATRQAIRLPSMSAGLRLSAGPSSGELSSEERPALRSRGFSTNPVSEENSNEL